MALTQWFGFRGFPVWHGYRRERPGVERSLCGRVVMPAVHWGNGPQRGRPCKTCAAIWGKRYPPKAVAS